MSVRLGLCRCRLLQEHASVPSGMCMSSHHWWWPCTCWLESVCPGHTMGW